MEERKCGKGEKVIVQGDEGDTLFVVESGVLSCYRRGGDGGEVLLKKYEPGDAFGELALLYNAPRAASIVGDEGCVLWGLDRGTFNHIVKDASRLKREKFE